MYAMYDCAYTRTTVMTAKCKLITLSESLTSLFCLFTTTMPGKKQEKERKRKEATAMCIRLVFMME